jgi:hypothetical protein
MCESGRPNADKTIALMRRAAMANLDTAGRQGLLIQLPGAGEVLVSGDIHGNINNLDIVVGKAALHKHPRRHLVVQELVHALTHDALDVSWRAVERAARLKLRFPARFHYLLGNHELAETLGIEVGKRSASLNRGFAATLEEVYRARWKEVLEAYRGFWRTAPMALHSPNRLFIAHSTPQADRLNGLDLDYLRTVAPRDAFRRCSPAFHMLWGRDYAPAYADLLAERLESDFFIVGHTPADSGSYLPNHRHLVLDGTHYDANVVLLPLDAPLTLEDIRRGLHRLNPAL